MLDPILESLTVYMMVGIVVIVGVSQFNRILGSILGIGFWIAVAAVGVAAYEKGGAIGLLEMKFSLPAFLGLCALLAGFNVLHLFIAMRRKRRGAARTLIDEDL